MERFILHITTEETYVSGQIFAVRDFDEALEVIKQVRRVDFDSIEQKFFREHGYCTAYSLYGNEVEIRMMQPLEYHFMIKKEYEDRRSEVIRLCGELSASAIEEGAKQMILSIFQILNQNIKSFGYQNSSPAKFEICQTTVDGFDDIFRICDQLGVELTDDHVVELHIDGRLDYEDFEVTGRLFKLELMLETKEEFRQRLEDELKLKYLQATGDNYE